MLSYNKISFVNISNNNNLVTIKTATGLSFTNNRKQNKNNSITNKIKCVYKIKKLYIQEFTVYPFRQV